MCLVQRRRRRRRWPLQLLRLSKLQLFSVEFIFVLQRYFFFQKKEIIKRRKKYFIFFLKYIKIQNSAHRFDPLLLLLQLQTLQIIMINTSLFVFFWFHSILLTIIIKINFYLFNFILCIFKSDEELSDDWLQFQVSQQNLPKGKNNILFFFLQSVNIFLIKKKIFSSFVYFVRCTSYIWSVCWHKR